MRTLNHYRRFKPEFAGHYNASETTLFHVIGKSSSGKNLYVEINKTVRLIPVNYMREIRTKRQIRENPDD